MTTNVSFQLAVDVSQNVTSHSQTNYYLKKKPTDIEDH